MFIINVNVLFLSNSQLRRNGTFGVVGVYHQCQCSLFKQFTTPYCCQPPATRVFIINVNVLFLSNSQQWLQSLSNDDGVYHQCQCSLFKQFIVCIQKKATKNRPLDSFHNGIILIVNCLKSDAKINNIFYSAKYFSYRLTFNIL